jgi:4'-phosphopantetheinyl transferase
MSVQFHSHGLRSLWVQTPPNTAREVARNLIRIITLQNLHDLTQGGGPVAIACSRGHPPTLTQGGNATRHSVSFAHESGLSVAAVSDTGTVGIDVARVCIIPDALDIARDYLDPQELRRLADVPSGTLPEAFALAWTVHEARLKCLGKSLREWDQELHSELVGAIERPLILPTGYVGWVVHRQPIS